jgi:threonyl-tRNA synthetase
LKLNLTDQANLICFPLQRGYDLVYSPHIAKVDLWKTSGHFDFYKENMYDQMQVMVLTPRKPVNE